MITRNHLLSLAGGAVGGISAGLFVTGRILEGLVGLILAAWSILVGITVVVPMAASRTRSAIIKTLTSAEPEDVEVRETVVLGLADSFARRFDQEAASTTNESKPVLAVIHRLSAVMLTTFNQSYDGFKQHLEKDLQAAGVDVAGLKSDDAESRWNAVVEGANAAGRPIPEKLSGGVRMLLGVKKVLETMGPLGGSRPALGPGKRKGPGTGSDGYY